MAKVGKPSNSRSELARLRIRLAEAEETIAAIREGSVDAIAVDGPAGRQIFTLQSAEQPYRILAEQMNEGAASISAEGIILFCNNRLATMLEQRPEKLVGTPILDLAAETDRQKFQALFLRGKQSESRGQVLFQTRKGSAIPVLASLKRIATGSLPGLCLVATDLTDLKRAENELRQAQAAILNERQRFESVLDCLPVMVCLLTPSYEVAFANHAFRKQFGESNGRKCFDYCFGRSAPCEFCESFQVLKNKVPHDWEVTIPNGRRIHAFDFPFTNTDGSPLILEMDIDITEQRQAEENLRKASLYTRTLIEASLDPLVTISKDGKITDVNVATEQATGLSRQKLIGSDFSNYFTEPEKARQGYRNVFAGGCVRDYPLALRHTSGSVMHVLYNATVFRNQAGEVEGVFAAARDITRRKQVEDELRALNIELEKRVETRTSELRESESRIRHKLDSILAPEGDLADLEVTDILDISAIQRLAQDFYKLTNIPLFMVDLKGKILVGAGWQDICTQFHRVNPKSCKNCLESDLVLSHGVSPGEFKLYKCKNNMWDAVTPLMLGDKQIANLFTGQFFFSDEPIEYELFRSQAQTYGFDEPKYMAALDQVPRLSREQVDTSRAFFTRFAQLLSHLSYSGIKLARSMEETRNVNIQLIASNKDLEAFTYSVSHDLRAPLRHISGFSKILKEEFEAQLPDEARHHLQRIEDGTHRMGQLVDDLLNLARVGRRDINLQVSGLNPIVDEVVAALSPDVGDRHVEWKIGELPYVECDPALIKQVFQNLLANALKFTRPRDPAIIEVGQEFKEGLATIYVRDNGVGFSMKYADKLFGVFQRLHRSEDFEGTGVGLATVQRIIQKHGGRIWAEAELEKGAIFHFTIGEAKNSELGSQAATAGVQS